MNFVLDRKQEELRAFDLALERPGIFKVYIHNDDFTPMTFVIEALGKFFHLDHIKAKQVSLEAHTKGRAVCGEFTKEVAETRIDQAVDYARTHDHPLKWSMEVE